MSETKTDLYLRIFGLEARIAELKADLAEHQWVSVEDGNPQVKEELEVCTSSKHIIHAMRLMDGGFYDIKTQEKINEVYYWRYIHLPKKETPALKDNPVSGSSIKLYSVSEDPEQKKESESNGQDNAKI